MDRSFELPLDILRLIIDMLAFEPKTTLKVLSLTSKVMVPLCRPHLFSTLRYDSRQASKLSALLSNDFSIVVHVKTLHYTVDIAHITEYDDAIIEALCRHSSSLSTIDLYSVGPSDWNEIRDQTKVLFISLIHLPSVTCLHMTSIHNFPVVTLSLCANLTLLNVNSVTPSKTEANSATVGAEIPCLTELGIEESCELLAACTQPAGRETGGPILDFTDLERAHISIESSEDLKSVVGLLKMATCLQEFRMSVFSPVNVAELGVPPSLQTVSTLGCVIHVLEDGYDPLRGLNHLLKGIAHNNALTAISVTIIVDDDVKIRTDCDDWSDFDSTLTTYSAFPLLNEVLLELWWRSYNREDNEVDEILQKVTKKQFPQLLENENVQFTFSEVHMDYR